MSTIEWLYRNLKAEKEPDSDPPTPIEMVRNIQLLLLCAKGRKTIPKKLVMEIVEVEG